MAASGTLKMVLISNFSSLLIVAHLLPSPEKGLVPPGRMDRNAFLHESGGAGHSLHLLFVTIES
jgi:hypothetical protein